MKNPIIKLVTLLLSSLMAFLAIAESPIPNNMWDHCQEGIALYVGLDIRSEKDHENCIRCDIKNTSKADRYFSGPDAVNSECDIFYESDKGNWVLLRPLHNKAASCPPVKIAPGQTLILKINLSQSELDAIKARPLKCRLDIFNEDLKKHFSVESLPKNPGWMQMRVLPPIR